MLQPELEADEVTVLVTIANNKHLELLDTRNCSI
jgi:hypothetical protein